LVGIVLFAAVARLAAQGNASTARFEVASVKPNRSESPMSVSATPARFTAVNIDVRNLLTAAYRLPWFRIVNLPSWVSERYDITATMPPGTGQAELGDMLQALLVERFMLRAHVEARDQPVYALVRRRQDTLGPQLRQSAADCAREAAAQTKGAQGPDGGRCDEQLRAPGHLIVRGMPLGALANYLSGAVQDRVVVDRTGLQGNFDLELRFAAFGAPVGPNSDGASVYTALEEQLGLRLEPQRATVEVLVVDSIARPSPD
jgi:uncharacterized protein (TIGR03435 family)